MAQLTNQVYDEEYYLKQLVSQFGTWGNDYERESHKATLTETARKLTQAFKEENYSTNYQDLNEQERMVAFLSRRALRRAFMISNQPETVKLKKELQWQIETKIQEGNVKNYLEIFEQLEDYNAKNFIAALHSNSLTIEHEFNQEQLHILLENLKLDIKNELSVETMGLKTELHMQIKEKINTENENNSLTFSNDLEDYKADNLTEALKEHSLTIDNEFNQEQLHILFDAIKKDINIEAEEISKKYIEDVTQSQQNLVEKLTTKKENLASRIDTLYQELDLRNNETNQLKAEFRRFLNGQQLDEKNRLAVIIEWFQSKKLLTEKFNLSLFLDTLKHEIFDIEDIKTNRKSTSQAASIPSEEEELDVSANLDACDLQFEEGSEQNILNVKEEKLTSIIVDIKGILALTKDSLASLSHEKLVERVQEYEDFSEAQNAGQNLIMTYSSGLKQLLQTIEMKLRGITNKDELVEEKIENYMFTLFKDYLPQGVPQSISMIIDYICSETSEILSKIDRNYNEEEEYALTIFDNGDLDEVFNLIEQFYKFIEDLKMITQIADISTDNLLLQNTELQRKAYEGVVDELQAKNIECADLTQQNAAAMRYIQQELFYIKNIQKLQEIGSNKTEKKPVKKKSRPRIMPSASQNRASSRNAAMVTPTQSSGEKNANAAENDMQNVQSDDKTTSIKDDLVSTIESLIKKLKTKQTVDRQLWKSVPGQLILYKKADLTKNKDEKKNWEREITNIDEIAKTYQSLDTSDLEIEILLALENFTYHRIFDTQL